MRTRLTALSTRSLVKTLRLQGPTTLRSIHEAVERIHGKPIDIVEAQFSKGSTVHGVWFSRVDFDLVIHAATPSPLHRQQIVLHELAHILLRHAGYAGAPERIADLLPALPRDTIMQALRLRSNYTDPEEIEAEMIADKFSRLISRSTPRTVMLNRMLQPAEMN
jgi:hypothetical protein